jgi:hypothetical protein
MTDLRQALAAADADLREPVATVGFVALSDADLARMATAIEGVGRLLDAARALHAAEVARRATARDDMIAALGFRGAVDAVAGLAGVSESAAKERIRTGSAIAPGVSISGAPLPPRFEAISSAVLEGAIGIEAAGVLVARLEAVASRVDEAVLRAAEAGLVELASGDAERPPLSVDLVRIQAAAFVARIDPDGARPREERARRGRSLRFGRETADGLTPVRGALLPVVAAQFQRLCDAHIKAGRPVFVDLSPSPAHDGGGASDSPVADFPAGAPGADTAADGASDGEAARSDTRTREQKRHDVLGAILDAAARVADAPHLAGAPPAVLVTVEAQALEEGRGVGFLDGMDTPVSLDAVEQLIDTAGMQPVTLSGDGAVLALGSVQRCFTPSQRRAITARDGGCLIPGCPIPAGWCEVHHVIPHREGGATHTDNGVLLCWWHHHIVDSGPWRLRMVRGVPQVRGPGHGEWTVTTKRRTHVAPPRAASPGVGRHGPARIGEPPDPPDSTGSSDQVNQTDRIDWTERRDRRDRRDWGDRG